MKRKDQSPNWLNIAILILLTLNLLFMATQPASANAPQAKPSNSDILEKANKAADAKDWVEASIEYAIYIDREPALAKSDSTWWNKLTTQLSSVKGNAHKDWDLANDVRDDEHKDLIISCAENAGKPLTARYAMNNPPAPLSMLQLGPAPDEIWVFQDFDFQGRWNVLPIGNYVNSTQIDMPEDSISSVMVGTKVRAYLCSDPGLNGTCGVFVPVPNHHPNLSNNTIGNDTVSSIRVEPLTNSCSPGPNQVTIFMHFDFQAPCQTLEVGDYNNANAFNLPDNGVSSIQVGSNVQASLCQNNYLTGTCETFNYNDNNLSDNTIGNDTLSSISVGWRP